MATEILSPDFGTTAFPRRSFNCNAALATTVAQRKRVRFARELTDEFTIANRCCRRGMTTADEKLCNRVYRIRRQLKRERKIVAYQTGKEEFLERKNDKLICQFEAQMIDLQSKQTVDALNARIQYLDDATFNLRMDIIRIKGKMLAEVKRTTSNNKNAVIVFAQSLWAIMTKPPAQRSKQSVCGADDQNVLPTTRTGREVVPHD